MNNLLTAIAVFMVVVLSALFTVPMMINWDDYRGDFEGRLSEILGSRVELDGSLNVRLFPTPYVRAENLRIGESGVHGRPVLEVKELTLWVAVPPLLKGVIEASTLTLERPRLLLQFDEKGHPTFNAKKGGVKGKKATKKMKLGIGNGIMEANLSGFKLSPQLISLKNVHVNNGEVLVQTVDPSDREKVRRMSFTGVDGVLSAVTLKGPFYFNGRYARGGDPYFVRLAVGKEARAGHYPMRAKLTLPSNDKRFEFDGNVIESKGKWRVKGGLKAVLRLGGADIALRGRLKDELSDKKSGAALETDRKSYGRQDLAADRAVSSSITAADQEILITSKLHLSSTQASFDKIILRGGSLAKPQTVRGNAVVNWKSDLSLKGVVNGQAIDLNTIFGIRPSSLSKGLSPGIALAEFNKLLVQQSEIFDRIDFKVDASQIHVGGGVMRDFKLTLSTADGALRINELAARLPGNSRVTVRGSFGQDSGSGFDGFLYLRGLQFSKFMKWAAPSLKIKLAEGDEAFGRGKFILSSKLRSDGTALGLTQLQGNIGGAALRGELLYKKPTPIEVSGGERDAGIDGLGGETHLTLRAGVVDLQALLGKTINVLDYEQGLGALLNAGGLSADGVHKNSSALDQQSVTFNFAAQRLIFADGVQKDVRLKWRSDSKGSRIVSLAGESENGLKVVYEASDGTDGKNGRIDGEKLFLIEAQEDKAVRDLLAWSGIMGNSEFEATSLHRFLPLRVAVRGVATSGANHYRVDGVMGGSDAAFSVMVPNLDEDGSSPPVILFGGMESANGAILAAKLLPFGLVTLPDVGAAKSQTADKFGVSRLTFSASGTAAQGFKGRLSLENKAMSLSYQGGLTLSDLQVASDGVISLRGDDAAEVLRLFGFGALMGQSSALPDESGKRLKKVDPLRAEANISQTDDGFALSNLRVAIGDTQIRGTGVFEEVDGERRYRLALATKSVDIRTLLAPLHGETKRRNTGQRKGGAELWSAVPFKTVKTRGSGDLVVKGDFSITADELQISDHMSLSSAQVQWRLDNDIIEIVKLEGKSLGGIFSLSGNLRRAEAGYSLNGVATLTDGRLEEIGAAQEASLGKGLFSVNLSLSGEGKSVKALVNSLVGEGAVQITDGSLRQLSPVLVASVATDYLRAEEDGISKVEDDLKQAIDSAKPLSIGSLDFGLQLLDGTVRLRQQDLGIKPGTLGIEARLKLQDLSWSGNWSIQPPEVGGALVPPIYRRLRGDLLGGASFSSELDANEFERYLDLKHKEKELKQLEALRLEREQVRLEEEKIRAEAELDRIEAENARLLEEQKRLETEKKRLDDLNRSELPSLFP